MGAHFRRKAKATVGLLLCRGGRETSTRLSRLFSPFWITERFSASCESTALDYDGIIVGSRTAVLLYTSKYRPRTVRREMG